MSDALDLDRAEAAHRVEWRIQRWCWLMWGLVILAALAGLLGTGPLSSTGVASADGSLHVEYERFLHHHTPAQMRVLMDGASEAGTYRLFLSNSFLEQVELQAIQPEPAERLVGVDGEIFVFQLVDSAGRARAVLHYEAEHFGRISGSLRLNDQAPLEFSYFVYP